MENDADDDVDLSTCDVTLTDGDMVMVTGERVRLLQSNIGRGRLPTPVSAIPFGSREQESYAQALKEQCRRQVLAIHRLASIEPDRSGRLKSRSAR